MAQQFEPSSDTGSQLRAQRMTADESRAVIDLWQQERVEQTGLTDHPAVPDVAEGLDITVEDVVRLLQDVRAKRLEEERALATEQELSEIRLAEEERKLAEVQRQRAELRREQAEAVRYSATAHGANTRYVPQPGYGDTYELIGTNRAAAIFTACGIFVLIWVILMFAKPHSPQNTFVSSPVTVSDESATYDAHGKIKSFHVTCADGTGTIPCDGTTLDLEKSYLQNKHDKEVAAVKAAAVKKHDQ